MGVVQIVVLVVVVALVASRFFAYKLPRDPRPRAARKGDFARMFKRHIPSEPKTDTEAVEQAQKDKKAKKKQPPVVKVSAKELAAMGGMEKIKALEPGFSEKKFVERARALHAQFTRLWNARDEAGMAEICAPRVVDALVGEWESGFKKMTTDKPEEVRVGQARVTGRTAFVEAVFGTKRGGRKVREVWLLARALGGDDAQWEIQQTKEERA
ncbi:MAG: hypothetical protein GC129_01925 [Proteobacteria bacterium]|nr:hypothetical protein [Pseudomonadota bacterium]